MADPTHDLSDLLQQAFRYALALSHNRAVAEELVQDACVGIARRGGPWERGYLLASVRNRFIDRCRRNGLLKFEPLVDQDVAGPAETPAIDAALDASLETALGRLKSGEREMLYLAAVEEYTMNEIAELTGRPVGTVLSGIHRAKQKLREWLTPQRQRSSV